MSSHFKLNVRNYVYSDYAQYMWRICITHRILQNHKIGNNFVQSLANSTRAYCHSEEGPTG